MNTREKVKHLLSLFSGSSKVLVAINADPDAIASAMAVKRLLWRKVSEVAIAHFNTITRPDNLTMIHLTEPGLRDLKRVGQGDYDIFVIVDSQPDHHEQFSRFRFNVVIDHHPVSWDRAEYLDIRPDYGACSTIMTEYLKSKKIKPSPKLAAALMLGIKTDTADFTRQAGIRDIRAFQYLYGFADKNIVTKVERALMTQADLDFLGNAIRQRVIVNNRAYFHAGNMNQPDELVITADFFLTVARVNWSVVSGVYERKLVIIIRNDGLRKGAGNAAKEAFSPFGSAGGHKTMARAELDLKAVRKEIGSGAQKSIERWIISSIERTAGKKIE